MGSSKNLYLDRRANVRVSHHVSARFVPQPDRPLRVGRALTQDVSLRGARLLTSVIPQKNKPFSIWIPVSQDETITATATVAWTGIEDSLGDSAFWIQVGVRLFLDRASDREALAEIVARKANLDRSQKEIESVKTGFVF